MAEKVVLYERVSLEIQAIETAVSIDQQQAEMENLCKRNGWEVVAIFKDSENYRAAMPPNKGKIVNPSGERADRPKFLEMLELIKTGTIDAVLCWRDDRLVRHPRVAVALEDALDMGDRNRMGRPQIKIYDATGAVIDRFTLSIKATIWREENKRRAERSRMGKTGSLLDGGWPGSFIKYGYRSIKVQGMRGRKLEIDPETAPIVKKIFDLYDSGMGIAEIRAYLIREKAPQYFSDQMKHEWSRSIISKMLRCEEYLGKAIWRFKDGSTHTVDIPPIIEEAQWKRVQARIERNKCLSTRNAHHIFMLQGLLYCGDCGNRMSGVTYRSYAGGYGYRCHTASLNPNENHVRPNSINGQWLDEAIWRQLVDRGLKHPEVLTDQIKARVKELQAEGEKAENEFERVQKRIDEVQAERIFYQKQAARGKMTEAEFDKQMEETAHQLEYWQEELERLRILKYEAAKVQSTINFTEQLFSKLREQLAYLDVDPDVLRNMPPEEREPILKGRQALVRTLVKKVTINHKREVTIEGALDGTEGSRFELQDC